MSTYDWVKTKKRSIQAFRKGKLCITFESIAEAVAVGMSRSMIRNSIISGESALKGKWKGYRFKYQHPERFAMERRVRQIKLQQERKQFNSLVQEFYDLYPDE